MQNHRPAVDIMIEEIPKHNHKLSIHPKPKLDLFNVIENSYTPQQYGFNPHGYIYDNSMSDHETQVYHRYPRKHTIISTKGTNPFNPSDVGVDMELTLGQIKNTARYKKTKNALENVRSKLKHRVHLVGHSLGHAINSIASEKQDRVTGLNGPPHRHKIKSMAYKHYGVEGDIITKYADHTHKLKHTNKKHIAHSYQQLKDKHIEL